MIPLTTLALPRFLHHALVSAGYNSLDDLEDIDAGELARDLKISVESAQEVLRQADYRRGQSTTHPFCARLIPFQLDHPLSDHVPNSPHHNLNPQQHSSVE